MAPNAALAALAAQPAVPARAMQACEVTIFANPNFAGENSATNEDQPELVQLGWAREIASIQVKGGMWDFYSDENYAGETMRLTPGSYGNLGDRWTKRIASFMCAQPPQ